MRIRRRPLPFPPLLTSPLLASDLSSSTPPLLAPKTDSTVEQPTRENASVKIEQVLHPNGDLFPTNPHVSQNFSPPPSISVSPVQVLKKEESTEERRGVSAIESTRNAGAQVNIAKRRGTNGPDEDQGKRDRTMAKDEKLGDEVMAVKDKKTRRYSAVLLEGSRCSRVNGRGWRCCQPTLVGYSLCEHHLGKGRMRNMNNAMRGQLGCTEHKRNSSESGSADETVRKKRNKVPTVKARSISSLLDGRNGDQFVSDGMHEK